MATTIKLKNGSGAPLAGDLVQGEPALDLTNKRLYTENASGTVIEVGTNPTSLTTGTFTSTGIDDNATSTAITIDSSQRVGIGTNSPAATSKVNIVGGNAGNLLVDNGGEQYTQILLQRGSTANTGGDILIDGTASEMKIRSLLAGSMTFSTGASAGGATERMRIDSSGNVGIGTTSPSTAGLTLYGTSKGLEIADGTYTSFVATASTANAYGNGSQAGQLYLRGQSGIGFTGNGGGSTHMTLDSSGNVGIGTTSPWSDAQLTVDNGGSGSVSMALSRSGAGQNDVALVNDAGEFIVKSGAASTVAGLTEHMRIDTSGNVGIGTSSPSTYDSRANNLVVGDSGDAGITIFSGASSNARLVFAASGDTGLSNGQIDYDNANDKMSLATAGSDRMVIDSSGNVGIGDSSPPAGTKVAIQHDGTAIRIDGTAATTKRIFFRNTNAANPAEIVADGTLALIAEDSGMHMEFKTANTERMRITATGNTLMGLTSDYYSAKLAVGQSGGNPAIACRTTSTSGTVPLVLFTDGNSQDCGSIDVDASANTTNYGTSSDQRLKENIVDAPSGNIDDVRVRSFDWKSSGHHQTYGLVAQELVDVAPEAVSQGKKEEDTWKIDYSKLVPMMIKEIQDLKAEVAALKGA